MKFSMDDLVGNLRNLILSFYYHSTSTDTNSRHEYCNTFLLSSLAVEKSEIPAHSLRRNFSLLLSTSG